MEIFVNVFKRPTGKLLASTIIEIESEEEPEKYAAAKLRKRKPELFSTPVTLTFEKLEEIEYETL